jgi:hypothetical protein
MVSVDRDRLFGAAGRPRSLDAAIDKARTKMGRAYPCPTDIRRQKAKRQDTAQRYLFSGLPSLSNVLSGARLGTLLVKRES